MLRGQLPVDANGRTDPHSDISFAVAIEISHRQRFASLPGAISHRRLQLPLRVLEEDQEVIIVCPGQGCGCGRDVIPSIAVDIINCYTAHPGAGPNGIIRCKRLRPPKLRLNCNCNLERQPQYREPEYRSTFYGTQKSLHAGTQFLYPIYPAPSITNEALRIPRLLISA